MVFFAILVAGIPAATLLIIAIASRRGSRQPVGTVIAEYAPLPNSSVLFDAVLANADARALPAALIDLAIRKKIRLLEPNDPDRQQPDQAASTASKRGAQQLSIELAPGVQFNAQEQRVLAVFLGEQTKDRTARRLVTNRGAAGKRAAALLADTVADLAGRGLIAARSVRWQSNVVNVFGWIGVAATVVVAGICGAVWGTEATAPAGVMVGALAFCATIAALIVCPRPWRRFLPPSLMARRHLEGMREYIRLAEADRLRVLQSPQGAVRVPVSNELDRLHVYEQLLPYAILFEQEKEWAEVLRIESSQLEASAAGFDDVIMVAEFAMYATQLAEMAAHIAEATGGVGQVLDAGGAVLEGIGDLLNI
ncbi:DUF2207 family protein [Leucobacter salsicius]|uniref:DUF2207 family protein n=1 Tax=Leucobacter salsicius TaxID=664638 RepID=UPI00034CBB63|nr:DUF2207 domain-containing protein [Leucobacter salsicius]